MADPRGQLADAPGDGDVSPDGEPSPERTVRIVLADDHPVVRSGLRLLLDREADFEVVAEADDLDSARRYVRGTIPMCSCST